MGGVSGAVGTAAVLVVFPVVAAAVGSAVAAWRRPGPMLASGIQHFAAGVVFAALVGEVLPDLRQQGQVAAVVLGFAAGVAVLVPLGAWSRRAETAAEQARESGEERCAGVGSSGGPAPGSTLPVGLLAAVGIDLLLDGLLVGLGVTLGSRQGLILTIALTVEILFLGLSVAAQLTDQGQPRLRAAVISSALGLATAVGGHRRRRCAGRC